MTTRPVSVLLLGAGDRGTSLSNFALDHPNRMKVVGVAEPRKAYRDALIKKHDIAGERIFADWQQALEQPRMADAVLICTQDQMHKEPAIRAAELGYHILLEKPMAIDPQDCFDIVGAVRRHNVIFGVCHVLRYTRYTQKLKQLLADDVIGDIITMQHLEPVGYWHQAHSFVRGNWGNEERATFMLLAKSCHDIDWIRYIMNVPCKRVSSFGSLSHFNASNKPAGAGDRCLDCSVESECPYSAKKIYLEPRSHENFLRIVTSEEPTDDNIQQALATGPYGRCVYACNNNVVDHQVVNMEFESGKTVSFTMTAFTEMSDRKTRIFGSKGWIEGNGEEIRVYDFLTEKETEYPINQFEQETALQGHGGGDYYLVKNFIEAVAGNDRNKILSGPDETLESHLIVFSAEQSRRTGKTVELNASVL